MDMIINGRSCLGYYGLTLEDCYLSAPKRKRMLLNIPGADGEIDLLEGWGEAVWESRTVTARFRCGTDPGLTMRRLLADLEGKTVPIILPGIPDRYITGMVHISAGSVFRASEVLITAECDPWLYTRAEQNITVPASEADQGRTLHNRGTRRVVPELTVSGADAVITVAGEELTFPAGTHTDGRLSIPGGKALTLAIRGGGVTIRYREAVLL